MSVEPSPPPHVRSETPEWPQAIVGTSRRMRELFEMVGRVADRAVQIHGGAGYIAEYKAERFYRDVRLLRLYEGTTQIQQLIIAKNLLRD